MWLILIKVGLLYSTKRSISVDIEKEENSTYIRSDTFIPTNVRFIPRIGFGGYKE